MFLWGKRRHRQAGPKSKVPHTARDWEYSKLCTLYGFEIVSGVESRGLSCLQEINAWLPERGLSKYRTNDGRMVWDGS